MTQTNTITYTKFWIVIGILCLVGTAAAASSPVSSSANYILDWYVIGGGGGDGSSTLYRLSGTVGQITGHAASTSYQLDSGFWSIPAVPPQPSLQANFTSNVTSGTSPLPVQFTDTSTGSPVKWNWSFGDGTHSMAQNPAHTYTSPVTRNYTVSLNVSTLTAYNTVTKVNYIRITVPLRASFTVNVTSGLPPLAVKFTDTSTGSPVKWNWSFGDGTWFNTTVAAQKSPAHTYSATGTYTAKLSVCNTTACNTTAPGTTITVGGTGAVPIVKFISNVTSGSAPLAVKFIDMSTGLSINKWNWSFGDGTWFNTTLAAQKSPAHVYSAAGSYTAKLIVCNTSGCNTTAPGRAITVTSLVAPVANFTTNVTTGSAPLAVKFMDTSVRGPTKWNWSFGDGTWFNTTVAAQKNPAHVYSAAGAYTAKLTACNAGGCNTTIPGRTITVTSLSVPIVKFVSNRTSGTAPLPVKFIDQSTGGPTDWRWGFGDGSWFNTTVVSLKNPAHTYTVPGSYPSRLIACNAAGCNTTATAKTITVT